MPFSDIFKLQCTRLSTRLLATIMSFSLIFPYHTRAAESSADLADALRRKDEKDRLQDTKIELMLKIAARATMSEEDRKKAEEEDKKKMEEAKSRIEQPPEAFDTPLGNQTRSALKNIVDATPILGVNSTKEDVSTAQAQIQKATAVVAVARQRAIEEYHKALHDLPIGLINALSEPLVTKASLSQEEKLDDILSFLDPSQDLSSMSTEEKASYVYDNFTNQGVLSSELTAALHRSKRLVGILEENGHKLAPEEAATVSEVGAKAEQAVDVHRAGADYAMFANQMMTSAMMTGNPYVVAAMAALIILLAILQMIFGGGGGDGDGDRDGEGDGEGGEGRTKGATKGESNPEGAKVNTTDPRPGGEQGNPDGEIARATEKGPEDLPTSFKDFGDADGPYAYVYDATDVFTFYPRGATDRSLDVKFRPKDVNIDPSTIEELVSVGGSPKACVAELIAAGETVIVYSKDQGQSWFLAPPPREGQTISTTYVLEDTTITLFPKDAPPFAIDLEKVEGVDADQRKAIVSSLNNVDPAFNSGYVRLRLPGVDVVLEKRENTWTATEKGMSEE